MGFFMAMQGQNVAKYEKQAKNEKMFVKPEKTLAIIAEFRNITICIFENLLWRPK